MKLRYTLVKLVAMAAATVTLAGGMLLTIALTLFAMSARSAITASRDKLASEEQSKLPTS